MRVINVSCITVKKEKKTVLYNNILSIKNVCTFCSRTQTHSGIIMNKV